MDSKEDIVKHFSKYCAQCNGQCCKRGVFTVFNWEMKVLSRKYKNFHEGKVSEERGTAKDISICNKCMFSFERGCKLPVKLRPTDCLTYPFYPKVKETKEGLEIDSFVIQKECSFCNEIAEDKELSDAVHLYWKGIIKSMTAKEIVDWIGENGTWADWYRHTITVKNVEHK